MEFFDKNAGRVESVTDTLRSEHLKEGIKPITVCAGTIDDFGGAIGLEKIKKAGGKVLG